MRVNTISFTSDINKSGAFSQFKMPLQPISTAPQTSQPDTFIQQKNQDKKENLANNILKYSAAGLGVVILGVLIVKGKNLAGYFKKEKPVKLPGVIPVEKPLQLPKPQEVLPEPKLPVPEPVTSKISQDAPAEVIPVKIQPQEPQIPKITREEALEQIQNAELYKDIKNLRESIETFDNPDTKKELNELIENRINVLSNNKESPELISVYEMSELMDKYLYKSYTPSEHEVKKLQEKYGEKAADRYLYALKTPVDNELQIRQMTFIANNNDGKYLDFWKNNPEKLLGYNNTNKLLYEQICLFDENTWDSIIACYKTLFDEKIDEKMINAVIKYTGSGSYDKINGVLRFNDKVNKIVSSLEPCEKLNSDEINLLKNNISYINDLMPKRLSMLFLYRPEDKKIFTRQLVSLMNSIENQNELDKTSIENLIKGLKDLQQQINNISKEDGSESITENLRKLFLVSSSKESDIPLTRIETTDFFNSLIFEGEKLSKLMLDAENNPELETKILKYFNETKPSFHQPGFLSTSIEPYETLAGNVRWHLNMGENVKYFYLSDCIHAFHNANNKTEAEILIHPDHTIKVSKAVNEKGIWHLWGTIEPENA